MCTWLQVRGTQAVGDERIYRDASNDWQDQKPSRDATGPGVAGIAGTEERASYGEQGNKVDMRRQIRAKLETTRATWPRAHLPP